METSKAITRINGTEIMAVDRDGEIYVPIKPICQALGIAFQSQHQKLQTDPILSSVVTLSVITAADGKAYETVCLPLKFVYGWLFTINPANVSESARESVTKYKMECYEALYNHFTSGLRRQIETNNAEIALLGQINAALAAEKEAKSTRKKAEEALSKLRAERLNPQPMLFD